MRGGARPGAGRPRGEGYQTVAIALPRSEAAVLRERAAAAGKTVSRYIAEELQLKEENMGMSEEMKRAIDLFMQDVKPWELNKYETNLLTLAQSGNEGALCELLASHGLHRQTKYDDFYISLNADGE